MTDIKAKTITIKKSDLVEFLQECFNKFQVGYKVMYAKTTHHDHDPRYSLGGDYFEAVMVYQSEEQKPSFHYRDDEDWRGNPPR